MKIALTHDFLTINSNEIKNLLDLNKMYFSNSDIRYTKDDHIPWPKDHEDADDILLEYYKRHRNACISIHDDFIRPKIDCFEKIDTLYGGFIPFRGLNYYGFTLIPTESISLFTSVLKKIQIKSEYNLLIKSCYKSLTTKNYILHCGV